MKSHNDISLLYSLIFVGLLAGFSGHFLEWVPIQFGPTNDINSASALLATENNLAEKSITPPVIQLGFVGDIMLDRGVKSSVIRHMNGDYTKLFAHTDFLKAPDIMFANLEGPVSDKGTDQKGLYSFRMNPNSIPALKQSGIDVVSFANNHVGDYERPAFEDTLRRLNDAGILTCGAGLNKDEAMTPAIVVQSGFRVGYLCFSDVGPDAMMATDSQSGILLANDIDFDSIVQNASKKVDALIVSFHFGVEYQTTHTLRQEELANRALADGAVMIVGAHPHVPQEITYRDGAPILYSLGNFIFDQYFSKETMGGLFVTATLVGKNVSNVTPWQVNLDNHFVPNLAK